MQKMGEKDDTKPAAPPKKDETQKFFKPIVTSMQRIGGASISMDAVNSSLDVDRNNLLAQIRDNIAADKNSALKPNAFKDLKPKVAGAVAGVVGQVQSGIKSTKSVMDQAVNAVQTIVGSFGSVRGSEAVPVNESEDLQPAVTSIVGAVQSGIKSAMPQAASSPGGQADFFKLDQERNRLLKSIDTKVGRSTQAVFA